MTAAVKKTYDQLVAVLAPDDRLELAEMLLIGVDGTTFASPELNEAWNKEIDQRVDAYEAGKVKLVPASEVHEKVRRRLNETKARRVSSRRAA